MNYVDYGLCVQQLCPVSFVCEDVVVVYEVLLRSREMASTVLSYLSSQSSH